jgi:hypothetical protein
MNPMSFFFDFPLYLNILQERKKTLEIQLSKTTSELQTIDEQLDFLESYFNPKVSISVSTYPNGSERYIGRFKAIYPDGNSKQVAINLGPIERFEGRMDPKLIELAKQKAAERYSRVNPNYLQSTLSTSIMKVK